MKSHLHIDFLAAGLDIRQIQEAPFPAKYPIHCDKGKPTYYKGRQCAAILQEHDAIDVYILTVEIRTEVTLRIPVKTDMPDLYWLYQPAGESRMLAQSVAGQRISDLPEKHYCQIYSKPCTAIWETRAEKVFLQLHIIKGKWAARYAHRKNRALELLISCKKEKRDCILQIASGKITKPVEQLLSKVRLVPASEGMSLDGNLQQPISHLADWHRGVHPFSEPLAAINPITREAQQIVLKMLRQEPLVIPTVALIQKKMGVNKQYLWQHYYFSINGEKQSLGQFIIKARLDETLYLILEEGYSNHEAILRMGYMETGHFHKLFRKVFGMTLKDYLRNF